MPKHGQYLRTPSLQVEPVQFLSHGICDVIQALASSLDTHSSYTSAYLQVRYTDWDLSTAGKPFDQVLQCKVAVTVKVCSARRETSSITLFAYTQVLHA